jgi:hypothetical protein
MEEAPENGKESSHSAHANGMKELFLINFGTQVFNASGCLSRNTFDQ